jgi:hypothetical protein
MDFSKNIKAYLNYLPLDTMRASQKLLAVAAYCAQGDTGEDTSTKSVRRHWQRSLLKIGYHPSYYHDAQREGWLDSVSQGVFRLTPEGLQHLVDISGLSSSPANTAGGLYIFDRKHAHSFDKFLRGILAGAQVKVWIADSYVDDTIFDNVIDSADSSLKIRLIYGQKGGSFDSRVSRFQTEYPKFLVKRFNKLHDRFMVVDNEGYVIGPSIKDAANNSPALVVKLSRRDSTELEKFFQYLWSISS